MVPTSTSGAVHIAPADFRSGDETHRAIIAKQTRDLIKILNRSVRNHFRRHPEILAEWTTAARIHRTGRRGPDDTPPPASPTP